MDGRSIDCDRFSRYYSMMRSSITVCSWTRPTIEWNTKSTTHCSQIRAIERNVYLQKRDSTVWIWRSTISNSRHLKWNDLDSFFECCRTHNIRGKLDWRCLNFIKFLKRCWAVGFAVSSSSWYWTSYTSKWQWRICWNRAKNLKWQTKNIYICFDISIPTTRYWNMYHLF